LTKGDQLLSTLAASLLSELARSGAEAERLQRNVYAELAAEVAVPVEVHEARAAGTVAEEQQAIADTHLACFSLRPRRGQKDVFVLDDAARSRVAAEFAGVVASIDGAELTIDDVLQFPDIERRTLQAFVTAGLKRDARRKYLQTQALLRDGLPHATIHGGQVKAKVILSTGADGRIVARFANEKNVTKASADAISELTFDFTLGAFPPTS
jgi:hypothetical protein